MDKSSASVPVCDKCQTEADGIRRDPPKCDGTCPLHEECAFCGSLTNGRRVRVVATKHAA